MENLDQIRAAAALAPAATLKRGAISKLPGLIINNGLLAAAAFAEADGGGDNKVHLKNAMVAVARHLSKRGIIGPNITGTMAMIEDLSQRRSSLDLQRATSEALAFLSYLKRFAPAE